MKKRILIIEDDRVDRENITSILQLADYDIIAAENGKLGVEKACFYKPDLILCGVLLPELDGYGVLQVIMRNRSLQKTPLIFMSGKNKHEDIRRGMDLGASDYITKPLEESELLSAVASRLKIKEILEYKTENKGALPQKWRIDDIEKIFKLHKIKKFKTGSTVYCEGSIGNHIYYIVKGEVKTFRINRDGKELITEIYEDKSFFGFTSLLENKPYLENAEAIKPTELIRIKKYEMMTLIRSNPQLGLNFIDMLTHDLEHIKDHLMHLVYDSVRRKTADAIIQLHHQSEKNQPLEISRSDLASFLGIAKETLTRTLTEFKEKNLIRTYKNQIVILDEKNLQKIR